MANLIQKAAINYVIRKGRKTLTHMDGSAPCALKINIDNLLDIIEKNKDTEYGRKYDFAGIHSLDDYRKKVPFSNYDTYAPYIERMSRDGEKNLLTAEPPARYVMTSGSMGVPKYIPVSQKTMDLNEMYSFSRILAAEDEYLRKKTGKGLNPGKVFCTLDANQSQMPDGTPLGGISGSIVRQFKPLIPLLMSSPEEAVFPETGADTKYMHLRFALTTPDICVWISTFMTHVADLITYLDINKDMLCDDIAKGTINEDVKLSREVRASLQKKIRPDAKRAAEIREILKDGMQEDTLKRLWPNLSCISAVGTGGFTSYTKKVKEYSKGIDIDYLLYCASEGIFGSARYINEPKLYLLPESCFYEFLPADSEDADPAATLTLDQLEVGKDYEIIITNPSGFYRYRILDVIRVLGYEGQCPVITFAYRKNEMMNIAGEKTSTEDIAKTMEEFSRRVGINISDYVVYEDRTVSPARYSFIIESNPQLDKNKLDEYSQIMEEAMQKEIFAIKYIRDENNLSPCAVFIQQPQTHLFWRELRIAKGATPNQVKPVKLLDNPVKLKFFTELIEK